MTLEKSEPVRVPRHIAIIMDGNGRWARKRNLPRLAGHRAGTENIRRIVTESVQASLAEPDALTELLDRHWPPVAS